MFSVLLNERVSFVKRSGLCWWRKVDAKKKFCVSLRYPTSFLSGLNSLLLPFSTLVAIQAIFTT